MEYDNEEVVAPVIRTRLSQFDAKKSSGSSDKCKSPGCSYNFCLKLLNSFAMHDTLDVASTYELMFVLLCAENKWVTAAIENAHLISWNHRRRSNTKITSCGEKDTSAKSGLSSSHYEWIMVSNTASFDLLSMFQGICFLLTYYL